MQQQMRCQQESRSSPLPEIAPPYHPLTMVLTPWGLSGGPQKLIDEMVKNMLAEGDHDNDKKISFEELKAASAPPSCI